MYSCQGSSNNSNSSNLFETRLWDRWSRSEVVKNWDDVEIAKVIVALRERCLGTAEFKTSPVIPRGIFLKTDGSITMNENINDTSVLEFAHYQIKDFKLINLKIGDHEINLEIPKEIASDTIVAKGKNYGEQSFDEIRNGVRSAIEDYCFGSKELNLRNRALYRHSDGSYTLNYHQNNLTYLGQVYYKVEDFKITRIAMGLGFENAPEIIAAFEGHDI